MCARPRFLKTGPSTHLSKPILKENFAFDSLELEMLEGDDDVPILDEDAVSTSAVCASTRAAHD